MDRNTQTEPMDDDVKKLRRRMIYIEGRMPDLKEELRVLGDEKKHLKERLKEAEVDPAASKVLKHRKIFITSRVETLKIERQSLMEEQKQLHGKLKPAGAKSRDDLE